jgi:DNA-binding response OmpR family regulator
MRRSLDEHEPAPSPLMERLARLGVELIRWPDQASLRSALARAGVPRLLLVETDDEPPNPLGLGEDWARLPTDDETLIAQAEHLLERMAAYSSVAPIIGADRVLRRAEASVALSPSEAKIVGRLLDHSGTVVGRDELELLLWPDGSVPGQRSLDYVVQRLRRRIAELNICINTSRGRGFVIYIDDERRRSGVEFQREPNRRAP